MAAIGNISGTGFIGNPITVPVTPGQKPSEATFHRVCLDVHVGSETFPFSQPAVGVVYFDVSSALQAVADRHEYHATTLSGYPVLSFTCEAWDEWMIDGQVSGKQNITTSGLSNLFVGALTDYERIYGRSSQVFSRKPSGSPEPAFVGCQHLAPASGSPAVSAITVQEGLHDGVYGIVKPQDGYEIRFINGFGVHENVFVTCLRTVEVPITTDKYVVSKQETVTEFSRGVAIKKNNHERWKMSSGPLDLQWQQWYLHELMLAEWAWINTGTTASPVWMLIHILPDETVKGIDRQKASLLEVEFTIEFDINGSPFAM